MTFSSFRHDKIQAVGSLRVHNNTFIIIVEVSCFEVISFEVIKRSTGPRVNVFMLSCFQVIIEMFHMTGVEMCVFVTVLLFCLMAAIMRMMIDSVYRSVERKEVTVKMKKIRGSYLRLRMKVLCRW